MAQRTILIITFASLFVLVVDAQELCHGGGTMTNGVCNCQTGASGPNCEELWIHDQRFFGSYLFQIVITVVSNLVLSVFCVYQLIVTIKHSTLGGWRKWSVITLTYSLLLVGAILRIVSFSIDPHGFWGILPRAAGASMSSVTLVCWIAAGYAMSLYWLELQMQMMKNLGNLRRTRPVLIALTVLMILGLLPTAGFAGNVNEKVLLAFSLILAIFLAIVIIFFIVGAVRLQRVFKRTASSPAMDFMKRLNKLVIVMSIFLTLILVFQILNNVVTRRHKFGWVLIGILSKICEFVTTISLALFMKKKRPNKMSSSSESKDANLTSSNFRDIMPTPIIRDSVPMTISAA